MYNTKFSQNISQFIELIVFAERRTNRNSLHRFYIHFEYSKLSQKNNLSIVLSKNKFFMPNNQSFYELTHVACSVIEFVIIYLEQRLHRYTDRLHIQEKFLHDLHLISI